jgi:asparagine synthase (glutamine-hydrolysing)
MRRARFVAIIAHTPECRSHWEVGLQALVSSASEVRWVLKGAHVLVVARGNFAVTPGEQAIFIGSIFERGSSRHAAIPKRAGDFGFASLARHLIEHHWGGYVAIHEDRANQSVTALRAPLGDLPCFWSECDGAVMLGSDLSLMEAAGLSRPTIDRQALARYLVKEDVLTGETCLSGVREIRGGEMLTFAGAEPTQEILWSPWTFASASRALEDAREGQRQIRDAALLCVDSLARDQSGTVLKLSGGIDSSIVAACLKEGGHKFTAVNLVTKDPSGDERKQARLVAKSLSVPLIEAYRQVDRVALERSAAAGRPRPCARSFTQETSRICTEVAEATGSSALFDGGGGDNVFSSLQSARPAADALLRHGPGRLFWRTAADIAGLAQVNLWKVARSALLL